MVEGSFSSPRSDAFPAGLRVLVVDDDPTWLRILEKMLKKCLYEVTTCCLARDALSLLRERKDGFDIVISDVNMPDMDGFKLLEHVGLEMDLPVIMMSVDGETSRVMKGVQHGACDYLLKPIRMKELRNIWQHVFRKKIHEVRDIENLEGIESIQMTRSCSEQADNGLFLSGEEMSPVKKRKDHENKHDEKDFCDASSTKKARVVWSVDLHQKFVKAVNQIGFDKVGPKKILDLMNVPWLTRENVASHLQKYRMYLSRLPKEHDLRNSFGGNKHSDSTPKESVGSCSLQNTINVYQHEFSDRSYGLPVSNSPLQNKDHKPHGGECKESTSVSETKQNGALFAEVFDPPCKAKSSERLFDHSSTSFGSGINLPSFSSSTPTQYSWTDVPVVQLKQESQPLKSDNGFNQLPSPAVPHDLLAKYLQPAPPSNSGPSIVERNTSSSTEVKPLSSESRVNLVNHSSHTASADLFSVESRSEVLSDQVLERHLLTTISSKSPCLNENCLTDLGYAQKNINWGAEMPFIPLDGELQFCLRQGDCYAMNLGQQGVGITEYHDATTISEIPFHLYDAVRFEYQNLFDSSEYCTIDQGSCYAVPTHLW